MELAFLLLLFVLEISLTVFTVMDGRDKRKWYTRRMVVRIAEMVSFLLFTLLPGVNTGFRFALCTVLLAVRMLLAAVVWLCRRDKAAGTLRVGGLVWRLLGSMALLFLALIPAFLFSGYDGLETTGEYDVKLAQAILVDDSRVETFEQDGSKREVPVCLYFPDTESGNFPLVLFSHGAFGYYQSNTSTYMELASHGYVVVSLDHPYHSFFTKDTEGRTILVDKGFLEEVQKVNTDSVPEEEILALSSKWLSVRTSDMGFVLDTMKDTAKTGALSEVWHIAEQGDSTEILNALSLADCEKIGLMGHSLGGAASVSLGRTRDDIGAVIDLDGTMLGEELAFEDGHYVFIEEPYPVPLLSVDNEEHHRVSEEAGTGYVNVLVLEHALDGNNIWFKGSGHMNFTDLPLFAPPLAKLLGTGSIDSESCIRQMNQIVLQFYDCKLKNGGELPLQEWYE